ncbi:MAG: helix-turn-helix domain-containing protein [Bacilli bacterium]|jgi:transcriptional regulator with XRE-family HTH domain|nr:helix-turn-helix domain-containing protein [Bacilli bacterium]
MNTGEKIAYQRKKHAITQEDLADQVGVSRQTVSKWEGNLALPDTASVSRLAEIFDVSTDYLIRDEVEEKEHVSQKKTLALNLGLMIGFLALAFLGFVLSIVTAYATYNVLNGIIVFACIWSCGLVGAIILLSVYHSRCDYDDNDRRFLRQGIISILFLGLFTLGMFIPLPVSNSFYSSNVTSEIVNLDLYWSWAIVGGHIGLALGFLLLPFILARGKKGGINKTNADYLFIATYTTASLLLTLTAGKYETQALLTLKLIMTTFSALVLAGLIVILALRKAIPLRTIIVSSFVVVGSWFCFYEYFALSINRYSSNYTQPGLSFLDYGFFVLIAFILYLLVEGILSWKKKKDFFFLLSFILIGSETLVYFFSGIIPTGSLPLLFFAGYFLGAVYILPSILLVYRYIKSSSVALKTEN